MDSVLGYSRTYFLGGAYQPPILQISPPPLLTSTRSSPTRPNTSNSAANSTASHPKSSSPFSDAMTRAGQLALLRRMSGSPIPPENFTFADITPENLSPNQPQPRSPDKDWPEKPSPPGNLPQP